MGLSPYPHPHPSPDQDRSLPKMVDALRGRRLLDLSCGTGHTLAVLDDGDVYAWGWNAKLQCGVPTPDGEP